ncbi:MAG: hypothetical protein HQL63_08595 [Magnetococcales bacterium]|nr:hypothetical protein [Magnetococcales bacterium]MBF0322162.1 hypothetical protein [Magnetococcales bacterium]
MISQCSTSPTSSSNLTPFNFESHQVRVITRDGEPWFVAKDVADCLGYRWGAIRTIGHVPDEWKGVESASTPRGNQEMHILSEPGLWFILGRSDKPKALPFQKKVAGEILPAIRKTGQHEHLIATPQPEQPPIVPPELPMYAGLPKGVQSIFNFISAAEAACLKGDRS